MNTNDGRIYYPEQIGGILKNHPDYAQFFKPMEIPPTVQQLKRKPNRVGRNDPCPCGSGMKFKFCCWTGK